MLGVAFLIVILSVVEQCEDSKGILFLYKRTLYNMQCKAKCNRLVYFFVLIYFDRQS
jgi:hypothetical protein